MANSMGLSACTSYHLVNQVSVLSCLRPSVCSGVSDLLLAERLLGCRVVLPPRHVYVVYFTIPVDLQITLECRCNTSKTTPLHMISEWKFFTQKWFWKLKYFTSDMGVIFWCNIWTPESHIGRVLFPFWGVSQILRRGSNSRVSLSEGVL